MICQADDQVINALEDYIVVDASAVAEAHLILGAACPSWNTPKNGRDAG